MLTLFQAFKLWIPLASMWALMSLEGPVVQAAAARAPEAALNLAAYGYAFFSMLILESPVFMFLSASNALVKGTLSYRSFRAYAYTIAAGLSLLCFTVGITGLFLTFSIEVVGLKADIAKLAEHCFICLSPCPFVVGYRRFHQGILVKAKEGNWIGAGGIFRIFIAGGAAFGLLQYSKLPGALLVCISVTLSVTGEALFARHRSLRVIHGFTKSERPEDSPLSIKKMNHFYLPLAFASLVHVGVQPVLTFYLAKSPDGTMALAAWPVLMSFTFLLGTPAIAYQDLLIAHTHDHPDNGKTLRKLGWWLLTGLTIIGGVLVLTPLYSFWFVKLVAISEDLATYMHLATVLCIPIAGLTMFLCWLKAMHTLEYSTRQIFIGCIFELLGAFILMGFLVKIEGLASIVAAILAFSLSRGIACVYLYLIRLKR